ncbi:hypothetical protein LINGRAHAP2_LOCUS31954 [Linum grandiflorum]
MEWVSYKYERLPSSFYYSCGRLGRTNTGCEFKEETVVDQYGEHTRAGPNSPAAPTPKKAGNLTDRGSPVVERRTELQNHLNRESPSQAETVNPFWGALARSVISENQR